MSENFEFKRRNYALRRALLVAVAALLVLGLALLARQLFDKGETKKKNVVHQITLVKPPPPPPPPPKQEEKPPEIKKEEVKIEEQKPVDAPQDAAKPAGEQLGLDADGAAGSDGFGLAARKGGTDLLAAGGGGSKHGWYAGLIQSHLQEAIAKNKRLRSQDFRAVVHIWLRPDGSVQRAELVGSSGKPDTDELIRQAFAEVPALREPPPGDLPQPVRLRVTNRL